MTSRLAGLLGLAALALSSSACTYKTQAQVRDVSVDYSDYAFYDRSFAPSPSHVAPMGDAVARETRQSQPTGDDSMTDAQGEDQSRGHAAGNGALGFTAGGSKPATAEATSTEYEEVEATPGTACYEAAVKAGIKSGVCTLVSERKYVLVGEKAR